MTPAQHKLFQQTGHGLRKQKLVDCREDACAWCGEKESSAEFAEVADMVRKLTYYTHGKYIWVEKTMEMVWKEYKTPRPFTSYAYLPPWFPSSSCVECGMYLLPYLWQLTDIWLLQREVSNLAGVISRAEYSRSIGEPVVSRESGRDEYLDHGPAPYALGASSPVRFERLFGHGEGGDVAQAVQEHQREPVF